MPKARALSRAFGALAPSCGPSLANHCASLSAAPSAGPPGPGSLPARSIFQASW